MLTTSTINHRTFNTLTRTTVALGPSRAIALQSTPFLEAKRPALAKPGVVVVAGPMRKQIRAGFRDVPWRVFSDGLPWLIFQAPGGSTWVRPNPHASCSSSAF